MACMAKYEATASCSKFGNAVDISFINEHVVLVSSICTLDKCETGRLWFHREVGEATRCLNLFLVSSCRTTTHWFHILSHIM